MNKGIIAISKKVQVFLRHPVLTENALLFNGKKIPCISGINKLFQNFQIFGGVRPAS